MLYTAKFLFSLQTHNPTRQMHKPDVPALRGTGCRQSCCIPQSSLFCCVVKPQFESLTSEKSVCPMYQHYHKCTTSHTVMFSKTCFSTGTLPLLLDSFPAFKREESRRSFRLCGKDSLMWVQLKNMETFGYLKIATHEGQRDKERSSTFSHTNSD